MNLFEAKHILKSVGYDVNKNLDNQINKTVNMVLESMEQRGATRTKAYRIISEMAIRKPKIVTPENPWNEADEKFSKLQATIQSKMSRSGGGAINFKTLTSWENTFNEIKDEVSNPSVKKEIKNMEKWFEDGATTPYKSVNNSNTGTLNGDFATDRKNIASSISSLASKGGKNYDAILARIDQLEMSCGDECTEEEANAIEKLRVQLEAAKEKAVIQNAVSNKVVTFIPTSTTSVGINRVKFKLSNIKAEYTIDEEGNFIITSRINKAKETLEGMGEFVEPVAPTSEPKELTFVVDDPEVLDAIGDIIEAVDKTYLTIDDNIVTITGSKGQLAKVKNILEEQLPELFETEETIGEITEAFDRDISDVESSMTYALKDVIQVLDKIKPDTPNGVHDFVLNVLNKKGVKITGAVNRLLTNILKARTFKEAIKVVTNSQLEGSGLGMSRGLRRRY